MNRITPDVGPTWLRLLLSEREPALFAFATGGLLADSADSDGLVRVSLSGLDSALNHRTDREMTHGKAQAAVDGLVAEGWLEIVDLDLMLFRLVVPVDRLGPAVQPTQYTYADAVQFQHADGKVRRARVKA